MEGARGARENPVAGEAIRVGGHLRLERDGAGEGGVVEGHDQRSTTTEADAMRPPGFDRGRDRLPWREDGPADPLLGEHPQGHLVDGRLGEPEAARRMAEPEPVVTDAPADLGSPIPQRGEGEDGVIEALGHGVLVAAGNGDSLQDLGSVARQVAREGGPDVEGDPVEIPALGVGPVALGRDPRVPAGERRGRRIGRGGPAERVAPFRLVEVGVDRQAAAAHRGCRSPSSMARSRVVVTLCSMRTVVAAPGGRTSGQAKTSADPW